MLEQEHIDRYWEGVLSAKQQALNDIPTARTFAEEAACRGCAYCDYLLRHEQVLGKTTFELISVVDSLSPGMR